MPQLKPVRFLKPHSLYNSGEIAGFPEEVVKELVDSGIAIEFVEQVVADEAAANDALIPDWEKQLASMTKAQLVVHAKENFDLDLSENMKKDDLIAEIVEAVEAHQEAQSDNGSADAVADDQNAANGGQQAAE